MTIAKIAMAALLTSWSGFQGIAEYHSGGTRYIFSNFSTVTSEGADRQTEKHIHAEGDLAKFQALEKGLTAVGKTLDFRWAQIDAETSEIRSGLVQGKAVIVIDTEAGNKALLEDSILAKKPKPAELAEFTYSQIDSELLSYSGAVDRGTIDMPQAWTFKQQNKGLLQRLENKKKVLIDYEQTFDCDGTKGQIIIGPDAQGQLSQLQSGFVEGPVHFKLLRRETTRGTGVVSISTYSGVADKLVFDLTTDPGTITALGNVTVEGNSVGTTVRSVVDQFAITVNHQMEPLGYHLGAGTTKYNSKDGLH